MREGSFIRKNLEKWKKYQYEGATDPNEIAGEFTELVDDLASHHLGAGDAHPWTAAGDLGHRQPGGQSRWSAGKDLSWEPLRPDLVAEVSYDHLQGDRFRHATSMKRWRPDRAPASCTYAQLDSPVPSELEEIFGIES